MSITQNTKSPDIPIITRDNVILIDAKFRLTGLRGAIIAFYLKTMLPTEARQFKTDTDFVLTFAKTFKDQCCVRACWYAWKRVKSIINQIKRTNSKKFYFAYEIKDLDLLVKDFLSDFRL